MRPTRRSLDPAFETDLFLLIIRAYGHTEESLLLLDSDEDAEDFYQPSLDDLDATFEAVMRAICAPENLPDDPLPF